MEELRVRYVGFLYFIKMHILLLKLKSTLSSRKRSRFLFQAILVVSAFESLIVNAFLICENLLTINRTLRRSHPIAVLR